MHIHSLLTLLPRARTYLGGGVGWVEGSPSTRPTIHPQTERVKRKAHGNTEVVEVTGFAVTIRLRGNIFVVKEREPRMDTNEHEIVFG